MWLNRSRSSSANVTVWRLSAREPGRIMELSQEKDGRQMKQEESSRTKARESDSALSQILNERMVAIVRLRSSGSVVDIARALVSGGIGCMEITLNTPNALDSITKVATACNGVTVGAGTVLDARLAQQAIDAGARFLVTPTVALDVIAVARRHGCPVVMGAMSPTEILAAWDGGAAIVKVFPAGVLGPGYIRALRGPFADILLAPTGGVDAANAGDFIRAGADVVCVGGKLIDEASVLSGRFDVVEEHARMLVASVRQAREETAP
jgi:2-dehydro-3-deoxyphosphogluconate aldolase/(4S)-4-hydroxy-2-oxoglutarate aldolase